MGDKSTTISSTSSVPRRVVGRSMCKSSYSKLLEKYNEIGLSEDQITILSSYIQEVFAFDPGAKYESSYNAEKLEYVRTYRARKKAEGISTYISSGKKASYWGQRMGAVCPHSPLEREASFAHRC